MRNGQGLPDDDTIRELAETHRQVDIAKMYDVTRGAVHHRFAKLGLTKKLPPRAEVGANDVYRVLIEYKQAHDGCSPTLHALAEVLHTSVNKVWRNMNALTQSGKVKRAGRDIIVVGARWIPPPAPIVMPVWTLADLSEPDADFSYWRFSANLAHYMCDHVELEDGNYTVEDMLREAGVITNDMLTDTEFSCLYVDFPSKMSAYTFIGTLNTFCAKFRKAEQ